MPHILDNGLCEECNTSSHSNGEDFSGQYPGSILHSDEFILYNPDDPFDSDVELERHLELEVEYN